MTESTDTPPTAGKMLQFGITVGQNPNGKHQVVTTIGGADFSLSFALPPDAAEKSGATMGEQYAEAARFARRADAGLIVPPTTPKGLITP